MVHRDTVLLREELIGCDADERYIHPALPSALAPSADGNMPLHVQQTGRALCGGPHGPEHVSARDTRFDGHADQNEYADTAATAVRAYLLAHGWSPMPTKTGALVVEATGLIRHDGATATTGRAPDGFTLLMPTAVLPGTPPWAELLAAIAAARGENLRVVALGIADLVPAHR